jgi:peptide-methionine (S)-S-oxide reductase
MDRLNNILKPLLVVLVAVFVFCGGCSVKKGSEVNSEMNNTSSGNYQTAMFGAGCFWQTEEVFRAMDGVVSTAVGYSGGTTVNPTYEQVCGGKTGHTEVVQITYDPAKISYDKLLDVFWDNHNPTTLYRQGPDVGYQYRSVIFYSIPEQKAAAEASKERLEKSGRLGSPIVTTIEPAKAFYKAEDYHQKYLQKRGLKACHY